MPWPYMTPSEDQPAQASEVEPPWSGSPERSDSCRREASPAGAADVAGVPGGALRGSGGLDAGSPAGAGASCVTWTSAGVTSRGGGATCERARRWSAAMVASMEQDSTAEPGRGGGPRALTPLPPAAYQEAPRPGGGTG